MVKGMNGNEKCTHWHGIYDSRWKGVVWSGVDDGADEQNKTEYSIRIIISVFNIVAPKTKWEISIFNIDLLLSVPLPSHIYTQMRDKKWNRRWPIHLKLVTIHSTKMHDSLLLLRLFLFRWFYVRVSMCACFPSIRLSFAYSHVCVIVVQVLLLSFKNLNKCHFLRFIRYIYRVHTSSTHIIDYDGLAPAVNRDRERESRRIYYSQWVSFRSVLLSFSVYIIYMRTRPPARAIHYHQKLIFVLAY